MGRWNILNNIGRAGQLVWKAQPAYSVLVIVLTIGQGGLPVAQLWISKLLIDTVATALEGNTLNARDTFFRLLMLIGIQASVVLLGYLLVSTQETVTSLLSELLRNRINRDILEKTNSLEIAFLEDEKFYNKLQNAYQEAGYRPLDIVLQSLTLLQAIVTFASISMMLIRLHWEIFVVILITTFPFLIFQNRFGFRNYWMLRERTPELRKQQYFGMLLTSNWFIKEIRVFQLEDYFLNLYNVLFSKFFKENRALVIRRNLSNVLATASSVFGWFLSAVYIVFRVVERTITIGDFAMYIQAVSATQGQIKSFLSALSGLYSNSLFLQNLFEFLSLPVGNLLAGKNWDEPIKEVEFRNVSFHYPGADELVLEDLSFKVCRGQSLALVGKNGAGKTTLVKLLCRLYEPTSGDILFNGKNIADYSPKSMQKQIAVLFQDYGHYYLAAKHNIGVGSISNLDNGENINHASRRSGADLFIQNLPHKFDTVLGHWFDDGVEISGGEWQKVALARAFFRGGGVLILDEPTASLDAEAEFKVFDGLMKDSAHQITLIISHRFSTVRMADHIVVLDAGKCIEEGSHSELVNAHGEYARLFKLQAKGYEFHPQVMSAKS